MFASDKGPSTQRACALFNCFRYSDAEQQAEHEASRASESCLLVIKIRAFNAHTREKNSYLLRLCSEPCMSMIKVQIQEHSRIFAGGNITFSRTFSRTF